VCVFKSVFVFVFVRAFVCACMRVSISVSVSASASMCLCACVCARVNVCDGSNRQCLSRTYQTHWHHEDVRYNVC